MIERVLKTAGVAAAAAFAALAIVGLAFSPRGGPPRYLDRAEDLFGTRVTVSAWSGDAGEIATRDAVSAAYGEVIRVAAILDRSDPASELSRACSAIAEGEGGEGGVELSAGCAEAVAIALGAARASSGAYDPAAAPLFARYRKMLGGEIPLRLPEGAELAQWRAATGYGRARLDGDVLTLEAGSDLDLGDLARGYAVDKAVEALISGGVRHASVGIGGQKRVVGAMHDSSSWIVGIESPRPQRATGGFLGAIRIADAAVSTSTDGGRAFSAGGGSHSRVIDPRTGLPAPGAPASVTVMAETCARAAWLSRALLVLGSVDGGKLIEAMPGASALFVTEGEGGRLDFVTAGDFPTVRRARGGGRWGEARHESPPSSSRPSREPHNPELQRGRIGGASCGGARRHHRSQLARHRGRHRR